MLKVPKSGKKPKTSKAPTAPKSKAKAKKDIPPGNLRMIAILEQWRRRPVSDEERQAWEEIKKSLDESRPHRPLFS